MNTVTTQKLLSLNDDGMSRKDIANTLNISVATVSYNLIKNGIRTNNRRGMFKGVERVRDIGSAMIQRCEDVNFAGYKYYGAKGITVCKEWHDLVVFKDWALANGYEDNLTIDRIDPTKGYYPDNCQWITQHEQVLRQERNSHRTLDDRYIYKMSTGKWQLFISTGSRENRVVKLSQVCLTKKEAIKHRDYFLANGVPLEFDNGYTPELSNSKKRMSRTRERSRIRSRHQAKELSLMVEKILA